MDRNAAAALVAVGAIVVVIDGGVVDGRTAKKECVVDRPKIDQGSTATEEARRRCGEDDDGDADIRGAAAPAASVDALVDAVVDP
jgi:hypothetical protein